MSVLLARAILNAFIPEAKDDARPCTCGCGDIGIVTGYARPFKARECDKCHFRGPEGDTVEAATSLWNAAVECASGERSPE